MLTRIVQMTFEPENIPSFERIFRESSDQIRAFPGCLQLDLFQDLSNPAVFFTFSIWESEAHLEAYRNSEFFREVWGKTRQLFTGKARAWSLERKNGS